jgi:hypothetical protein
VLTLRPAPLRNLRIDRINIRRATALAMQRAINHLSCPPVHLLVDGLPVPELGLEAQTAIVDGDAKVHSIAAASILAKVTRDPQRTVPKGWTPIAPSVRTTRGSSRFTGGVRVTIGCRGCGAVHYFAVRKPCAPAPHP